MNYRYRLTRRTQNSMEETIVFASESDSVVSDLLSELVGQLGYNVVHEQLEDWYEQIEGYEDDE